MEIILFEDERVSQLYPVSVGRAAFDISCGSYRLVEMVDRLSGVVRLAVRPHLRAVLAESRRPQAAWTAVGGAADTHHTTRRLLLNGRLVPSVTTLAAIEQVLAAGQPGIVQHRDGVALALLPDDAPAPPEAAHGDALASYLSLLQLPSLEADLPLLNYPHDIVRYHLQTLSVNLTDRLNRGNYQEIADGVFAAPGARLGQYVVSETSAGPILLDENASIGPYCYLRGPAYVGPSARVIEYAAIKDHVALGHTTKIGGEVEASVVEPYTNKQHHGFLGHSYLGSWVNLGAGTCNSDLKNTYGQVNMEYFGQRVPTGMQFFGCVMGDYAKTAINTGVFTGKTIGACSMVYGFVTTNVPSFVNYARSFGQVTEAPVEVLVATQARMFARRKVEQRPCDIQLLYDMHDLTRHERQIAGEPLSL